MVTILASDQSARQPLLPDFVPTFGEGTPSHRCAPVFKCGFIRIKLSELDNNSNQVSVG